MKKTLLRAVALTATLSLASVTTVSAGGSIGHGNFSVLNAEGAISSRLAGHNPIEEGALLVCDGKCMVKSQGISLIGSDQTKMAVASEPDTYYLLVRAGTVNFIINNNMRKLAFLTPQGTYTLAEVVFSAAGSSAVRGSVAVGEDGKTEISVTEGRLVFTTGEGIKTVDANHRLVLAAMASPERFAGLTDAQLSGIVAGAFALVLGGLVIANNSGGSPPPPPPPPQQPPPPPPRPGQPPPEPEPEPITPEDLIKPKPQQPASPVIPPYPYS